MTIFRNKNAIRSVILFSLILMFCGHAFCYANLSYSGASVAVDASKENASLISSGQFLATLYWRVRGALSAPLTVGMLSFLYLTASTLLISDMLNLTNPLSLWLVAMDGDRVAGYVGSQSVLGESDMMNVAVHPDYRRQGIAEKLCLALVDALKEKLGFTQVGLRKNYYRNPKEDACILRKEWEI